ncbi:hypothetical protein [Actinoallomurus soli]|uniref:hypothetical protein n=1 Tax=Actinoallomurus soli TaxID=2952535 RepID=UPI00209218A6|nr:hypothetical protein [Actinoallomurus soli]MCO5966923.1 hypothetical protein [Actinoallomurus soli]
MAAVAAEAGAGAEGLQEVKKEVLDSIKKAAARVALAAEAVRANSYVEEIRPNLNAIVTAARAWAVAASDLSNSQNKFAHTVDQLGNYWAGPAYTNFRSYAAVNAATTGKNSATLFNVGMQLIGIYNNVAAVYNSAVQMVYDTYAKIAEAEAGDGKDAIKAAIVAYSSHMSERHQTATRLVQDGQSQLASLVAVLSQFTPPEAFPSGVGDKTRWTAI